MTTSHLPSADGEPIQDAQGAPSVKDMQAAFASAGLAVSVEERTLALTASADGGMLIGIFIGASFVEFAKLMVDDVHAELKQLLQRFHRRGAVDYDVYVSHEGVDARVDSDLPPEAFLKLQGVLPRAPSGRIIFNRHTHRWQDSEQSE